MKSLTRIALPAALLLAACGDDITEQINANVGAVKNTDDLPACTEDIAGQTAYLKETHEFLGCDGSEWQPLSASMVSVGDNVCMSKSLSDDSGFEIFCNGESIGTVKNGAKGEPGAAGKDGADGKDGTNGKDGADGAKGDKGDKGDKGADGTNGTNGTDGTNGTGCEISEATALTATIACGSETFTMDLTGYVEQPAECDATQYEDCTGPMDNVDLSGVSQKGPFVIGADITAYELENGRSLKQTGKTFGGKIERADGTFDIKTVKLKSTFVYLVADGFYRNEVTGENSAATIKLRALTNRQNHANTNINLVTHLEYDRVQRLVTKEDSTVQNAKKAAEREIFAAFGIDSKDFKGYAEDYNILEEGDGNAALLAISALLQGDRNESELTALLAALSVDLGDNGVWDNQKQRAQIADWAMKKDIEGGLAAIRANIKAWKLRDGEPPAFEGHVRNFWMRELGVDGCSSNNAGALFATKNAKSAYYAANDSAYTDGDSSLVRLICADSGDSFAWRFATDIEKDTYGWPDFADQVRRAGNVNKDVFYVFEDGGWRTAEGAEVELGVCNSTRNGEVANIGKDYYTCAAPRWRVATTLEMDTYGWQAGEDGDVRNGHVNDGYVYVFDGDAWRRGSEIDSTYELGGCTKARAQTAEVAKSPNGRWYICRISGWDAASDFEKDTYGWETSGVSNGTTRKGQVDTTFYYVFDVKINGWRRATEREEFLQQGCTEAQQNLVKGEGVNWFTCDGALWRDATDIEKDTVGWGIDYVDANVSVGRVNNCSEGRKCIVYVFEDDFWREGTLLDRSLGLEGCTDYIAAKYPVQKSGAEWYTCENRAWRKASDIEKDTLGWGRKYTTAKEGDVRNGIVNIQFAYVYNGTSWRRGTVVDSLMKKAGAYACAERRNLANSQIAIAGDVSKAKLEGLYYECFYDANAKLADTAYHWVVASDLISDTHDSRCSGFLYETDQTLSEHWSTEEGNIIYGRVNQGKNYVCDSKKRQSYNSEDYFWRPMTESEKSLDSSCTISYVGKRFNRNASDPRDIVACGASGLWVNVKYWDWRASSVVWVVDTLVPFEYCYKWSGQGSGERGCGWTSWNGGGHTAAYGMITDNRGSEPQIYFTKQYYNLRDWSGSEWFFNPETYTFPKVNQTWMVQNLNYKTATGSRCFDDIESNCKAGGRLYTYEAAKNACPSGWHLPTVQEWENLIMYAGGGNSLTYSESLDYGDYYMNNIRITSKSFKALSSYNGWSVRNGVISQTTNSLGFSAIPAGYCDATGCHNDKELSSNRRQPSAVFWAENGNSPYYVEFSNSFNNGGIYDSQNYLTNPYYSVRCIKD